MAEIQTGDARTLHREMTEALCQEWEGVHAERDSERRRLQSAIRKAEAHFKLDEAERLKAQLGALG